MDLVRQTGVVVVVLRQCVQLAAHFAQQLAVVLGFGPGEFLGVLADQVAEPTQQVPTAGLAEITPAWVLEGRLRRVDGRGHVGGVAASGVVEHLARGRVGALEVLARRRGDPLAADEVLQFRVVRHVCSLR